MKYIVEVKYTNPSHEHVSLRRRVETVKRVVEAASEAEAIRRVANQQQSLGYMIREATVVESEQPKPEPEFVAEDRAMSAAIAGGSVGSKILTGKTDPNFGYAPNKMPPHLKAAQAKSDALSKVAKRPQAGTLAAANKSKDDESHAAIRKAMEREMMKKEEVAKEPPKSLTPTPKQNPNQKTTLSPSNPNVQKDDKLKEAADPGKTRVVNKKVTVADKMVKAAKGKVNKVNLDPKAEIAASHSHALSLNTTV